MDPKMLELVTVMQNLELFTISVQPITQVENASNIK